MKDFGKVNLKSLSRVSKIWEGELQLKKFVESVKDFGEVNFKSLSRVSKILGR